MAEEESNVEKGSKFDSLKIILIGVVVFVIALGASFFLLRSVFSPLLPQETQKQAGKEAALGTPFDAGEFTTNIRDVGGSRFMKVKVSLTISDDNKKNVEEATKYKPVIRDTILNLIATKSVADFDSVNRANLKEEIKKELNTKLGKEMILNVYFEDLIIQ